MEPRRIPWVDRYDQLIDGLFPRAIASGLAVSHACRLRRHGARIRYRRDVGEALLLVQNDEQLRAVVLGSHWRFADTLWLVGTQFVNHLANAPDREARHYRSRIGPDPTAVLILREAWSWLALRAERAGTSEDGCSDEAR